MLDESVNLSFDLDYTILQTLQLGNLKKYMQELDNPSIKSDDIFMEFESFIEKTKSAFSEFMSLLTLCDEQRKVIVLFNNQNFRVMLIKLLKDKMMLEKLLREEDNTLILNKLNIHDELKNYFISKNLDIKTKNNYLRELKLKDPTSVKAAYKKNDITGDSINSLSTGCKGKFHNSPLSSYYNSMINDSNGENAIKRIINMNLDFQPDKCSIISDSPIHNPCHSRNSKTQTFVVQTPIKKKLAFGRASIKRQSKSIDHGDPYEDCNLDTNGNYVQTEFEEKEPLTARLSVNRKFEDTAKKSNKPSPACKYKKSALKSILNISNNNKDKTTDRITISSTTVTTAVGTTNGTTSNSKNKKITAINSLTSRLKK
jgi:hypothetical protein